MSNEVINPYQTFRDDNGNVLANGTVGFYINTTATLDTIFSDEALTVSQTNPYPLDAYGRIAGDVKYSGKKTLTIRTESGGFVRTIDNVSTMLSSVRTVIPHDTLAAAVADAQLVDGDAINLAERTTGNGGGAMWDVVLSSTVTENTYNIVQCTGVGTLSLVLRESDGESYSSQWGLIESNSAAVNTPIIQALWDTEPSRVYYPPGEFLVTQLNLPAGTTEHIGTLDFRAAAFSSFKYDSGGSTTAPMVQLSTFSAGASNTFRDLILDTNDTALYGFYLASVGVFQAIKNMSFRNMSVNNLKSGAVGWQIGDQTNTALDTDAFNYSFEKCAARGSAGAIGWVIDATNAYNVAWRDCFHSRKDGSNFMLTGIKTIRGSGLRVYNYFGDKLQASGSPWVIDHTGGSLEVFGMSTEDRRVCKARSSGENDSSLMLLGVSVNDDTGDGDVCLDTTVRTSLDSCTFGSASYDREIIATNQLTTNHVFIGSSGEYTLSGLALNSSVLEGHTIGSNLGNIAVNELADLWSTTADPAAPKGWGVQKGTGTGTVAQATTNVEQGEFVVDINCTASNTDTFGIINNNYSDIDVRPFRGKKINFYAILHRDGTATPEFSVLLDGALTNVIGGTTVLTTAATGGTVLCWGAVDVQAASNTLSTLEIGIPSGQTGRVYLDSFGVIPYDFSSYVPALFVLAKNLGYDRFVSEIRAGTLRLTGYTLWVDNTGDLRIVAGDRATETDGAVVGTQS